MSSSSVLMSSSMSSLMSSFLHCLHTASPAMHARHRPTNVAAGEDNAPPSRRELGNGNDGRMTHDADGGDERLSMMAVVAGGMGDDG